MSEYSSFLQNFFRAWLRRTGASAAVRFRQATVLLLASRGVCSLWRQKIRGMERVGEMERMERKVGIIKVDRTCTSLALLRLNVGYRIETEEHASPLPRFPASLHPSQTTIRSSVYVQSSFSGRFHPHLQVSPLLTFGPSQPKVVHLA